MASIVDHQREDVTIQTHPVACCDLGRERVNRHTGIVTRNPEGCGARLGQGRDRARTFLEENPEVCEEIKQKVLAARGFTAPAAEPAEEAAAE